jgi:hypothetical protein
MAYAGNNYERTLVEYCRMSATKSESWKEYSIKPTSAQALLLLTKWRFGRNSST